MGDSALTLNAEISRESGYHREEDPQGSRKPGKPLGIGSIGRGSKKGRIQSWEGVKIKSTYREGGGIPSRNLTRLRRKGGKGLMG